MPSKVPIVSLMPKPLQRYAVMPLSPMP
jgi:hypothetical protein